MARPTTSGLPDLTRRADSGKCAYWRSAPPEFAGTVKGEVHLSWALKPHALTGQKVIKISLKTGDEALARRREAHPQVEAIFDQTFNTKNAVVALRRSWTPIPGTRKPMIRNHKMEIGGSLMCAEAGPLKIPKILLFINLFAAQVNGAVSNAKSHAPSSRDSRH